MDSPQRMSSPMPSSSPASARDAGASETILTPRSKIRALMARIDDSDDDDDLQTRPTRPLQKSSPLPETQSSRLSADHQDDDDEDDDEDVLLPRGRLAARMQAGRQSPGSASEVEPAQDSAYDRLRRELQMQPSKEVEASIELDDAEVRETVSHSGPMKRVLFTKKKAGAPTKPSRQNSDKDSANEAEHAPQSPTSAMTSPQPRQSPNHAAEMESDMPFAPHGSNQLLALVAEAKAKRLAKEAEEEAVRAKRRERMQQNSDRLEEILQEDANADDEDVQGGQKLSSQAKPTRKASKKAIEAMNRETQRMSRNMQLAHAATTRKKITKESLFAKFNFRQPAAASAPQQNIPSSSLPNTSRPTSDAEQDHQTPPTSPLSPSKSFSKDAAVGGMVEETQLESLPLNAFAESRGGGNEGNELLELDDLLNVPLVPESPRPRTEKDATIQNRTSMKMSKKAKGKQKADPNLPLDAYNSPEPEKTARTHIRNFRVKLPFARQASLSDSDSDLEIAPQRPMFAKFDAILAKAPQARNESNQRTKFRALAQLKSPGKQDRRFTKKSIPVGQMQLDLQRKAKEQIAAERAERLAELRAKGVLIQTTEERERDQMMNEDLLEKARREVEELTKKERSERKKEGGNGETGNAMEIDESDDESYVGSGSEDEEGDNARIGSEEEGDQDDGEEEILSGSEEDEEGGVSLEAHSLVDNEAAEDDETDVDEEDKEELAHDSDAEAIPRAAPSRRNRVQRVLDDDDDDEEEEEDDTTHSEPTTQTSPAVVNPFGNVGQVNPLGAAPMGLTQAFAATMEDSQGDDDEDMTQDSSAVVVAMPEPDLPVVDRDSLVREENQLRFESLTPLLPATQYNTQATALTQDFEMPEPTQDQGLLATSPIAQRFASIPPSTVDTLLVSNPDATDMLNANVRRKGRLLRRGDLARGSDDDDDDDDEATDVVPASNPPQSPVRPQDAFTAMNKAEKRRQRYEEFNKKKSAAKEVIDEQAEESEDEYAGLGGASDDESGGEMDEEVRKMLDDETQLELNESQLAAFHANKERASDEKAIEKLYKDINNGMLRRKRGDAGGFDDLSDSEDEAERRQRAKRSAFARMRKALLADENVGKIAVNPKKAAFFTALEDRDDADDDFGFNFLEESEEQETDLVREDSIQEVPNSLPDAGNTLSDTERTSEKRKRPLEEADPNARLPPALRRTKLHLTGNRKPANIAEIRESVSFLVEDSRGGEILVPATPSSDVEDDANHFSDSESRFAARRAANPVVDRLSIKRQESANSNNGGGSRVAFFTKGRDEQGFRVPSLLKKATTMSASGDVSFVTERTAAGNSRKEGEVKKGGTKKSSVAYFAREVERRSRVEKVEKRRETQRKKAVETRRGLLRGLGGGKFE